ncbi:MAG: class I SAM-dependent methyltransferase [bacterium]|nr:class I SAM-dependent methyltransferase [bacterium]
MEEKKYDAGSFRDPDGRVFYYRGEVFRQFNENGYKEFLIFFENNLCQKLMEEGVLIKTFLTDEFSDGKTVKHEKIFFISYPYEWPPFMLRDAGLLVLDLQIRLLENGYSLKDATPYNIQFVKGKPVWIDVASVEKWDDKPAWVGYSQFCGFFLYPLLFHKYLNLEPHKTLFADFEGVDFKKALSVLPFRAKINLKLFLDVGLPNMLRKFIKEDVSQKVIESRNKNQPYAKEIQLRNLRRLKKIIAVLAKPKKSMWSQYHKSDICNYSESALKQKEKFVRACLGESRCEAILDVGANTGFYSRVAVDVLPDARIVSIDNDIESINELYRATKGKNILPLVLDLTSPSPAIGWKLAERKSFLERANFDCVMALAVIHHLRVSKNIPMREIAELFSKITLRFLIVEFVGKDDKMFKKLTSSREDTFGDYILSVFEDVFSVFFTLKKKTELDGGTRFLYFYERKENSSL